MSIEKETLFRAVMRNEVLLWAGSGFSLYAGYPSGWGLRQILHESLTPSQRLMLDPHDPLPRYVEHYITLHNERRNELNRELLRVFSAAPKSLETHQNLATIPFIDQIVTTNYDSLFELAYGHRLHKVTHGKNIPLGEPNQVTLYKVHGDLQDPDSIVIADKDFRGFFRKNDNMLWTALEALMAKRHIVFVGYSLEDPNVKELYEWVREQLGNQMREAFFIAPNQTELNRKWMERNNLTYIDSTGEALVDELISELKESVLPNLKKGLVSQDKASQFLDRLGMNVGYQDNSQGLDTIHLSKKEGVTQHEISFSIKDTSPGSEGLKKAINGETLEPVRLSATDEFNAIVRVEGLRMPQDIVEILIVPTASLDKSVDIFFSDGTYFSDVSIRLYGSKEQIKIVAKTNFNTVRVTLLRSDLKVGEGFNANITVGARNGLYTSAQALDQDSELLRCLGLGLGFRCIENGKLVYEQQGRDAVVAIVRDSEELKITVENIRQIERAFSIIFKNFELTKSEWEDVTLLARILRLERGKSPWRPLINFNIDDSEEGREWKNTFASPDYMGAIALERLETWSFCFFGWKLEIQTIGVHILNNARVKYDEKLKQYSASNAENELSFIVKEIISKRIIEQPVAAVKEGRRTLNDIMDDWE
ncbi:SIR2 family protein [Hymenobacter sp. BT559]|uniref:SIR2 family NAD-dependent protein deacylase n=1 Tax=Hymenobacter sp. BT559 TaxID=2795729 RepID=UPI0018ED9661|nr:SIR2 family protein [Hymenobacter sp. BT559]MBJ6146398.1 SIR2 family protein [Hymenobacter sp. BT559]